MVDAHAEAVRIVDELLQEAGGCFLDCLSDNRQAVEEKIAKALLANAMPTHRTEVHEFRAGSLQVTETSDIHE